MDAKYLIRFFCQALFIFFSLLQTLFAWNAQGHMVIANIAYDNLNPDVRNKIDHLIAVFQSDYQNITSFAQMAYWPDAIRAQKIESYTHWHYIDHAFSNDGTPIKNLIDTDNALWAIKCIQPVVKNIHANPSERARFLAFLVHIIADLHQPLHTVSLVSALHPNGDRGGNSYFIQFNGDRINLHKLWDSGLKVFNQSDDSAQAKYLAEKLQATYPLHYFGTAINNVTPEDWIEEGVENAKKYVYSTRENEASNQQYEETGKQIAEQAVVLAGYRTAAILNALFY